MTDMRHMEHLRQVVENDLSELRRKEATYQGSWKASGGRSAWFMLRRKIDRLLVMMAKPPDPAGLSIPDLDDAITQAKDDEVTLDASIVRYLRDCYVSENIFAKVREEPSGRDGSVLAEVRDLRRYLLLVEAEMVARGVVAETPQVSRDKKWANFPVPKRSLPDCTLCGRPVPVEQQWVDREGFVWHHNCRAPGDRSADVPFCLACGKTVPPGERKVVSGGLYHQRCDPQPVGRLVPRGTPEDGGHHARQVQRMDDGEAETPSWPYITVAHVAWDRAKNELALGQEPSIWYNVDRGKVSRDDITHLPDLSPELNHKEWEETLDWYRGMYERDEAAAKWKLVEKYHEHWGRQP